MIDLRSFVVKRDSFLIDYSLNLYKMSTQTKTKEVIIQGKCGLLITVRILNDANKCIAAQTEFHAYQK